MSAGEQAKDATVGLAELLPADWFTRPDDSSVLVFCYRMIQTDLSDIVPPVVFQLTRVCAIFMLGSITYLDASHSARFTAAQGEVRLDASAPQQRKTPEEPHLLLVTPLRVDGVPGDQSKAEQRLQTATALVECVLGRSAVYELVFENEIEASGQHATATSPVLENPFFFPRPRPRAEQATIVRFDTGIAGLPELERHRVELSMRWLHQAAFARGVDAFLRYWIALETLAMPDSTNIKPLSAALSNAYALEAGDTERRFCLGRIFRLRGKIVHGGEMRPIHGALLKLMEGIYVDVVTDLLGFESLRHAQRAIDDTGMDARAMVDHSGPL